MKLTLSVLIILLSISITHQSKADNIPLQGQARVDSLLAQLPDAKGDTNEVNLLQTLSSEFRSSDPDKGIAYGNKGLKLAKKLAWKRGQANSYNSIATNYGKKSDINKALEYYQKSLKINKKIGSKEGMAGNYGNIGNIYIRQSDYPKAIEYLQKSLKMDEASDNMGGVALSLGNISYIYLRQSNYPKALEYQQRALKINEEIGNSKGIALNLNGIGVIYNNLSNYPKALEYQQKALKINEEMGNKYSIAINLGNIGNLYLKQLNYQKAIEYHQKALNINEEIGNKDGIALNLGNIGVLYAAQLNFTESIEYQQKSLKINEELGDKTSVAYNYMNIGELYLKLSQDTVLSKVRNESLYVSLSKEINLNRSIEYYLDSKQLFEEMNALNELSMIYYNLHEAYYQKGMYKQSVEAHRKYKELQDSIFSQENSDKIANLEKSREDDLKQKEIEKQNIRITEQEKREKLILYFSIGIVLLMTVVMIVIYRLLKRSDKLLYNVLPVSIAKRLKNKEHPISDYFEQASIVFIDIVNFTEMARDADPRRVVEALNRIFTKYDTIAKKYGLEKIKTIGDSYMAAAGIPEVQKDNTHRAAQMALEVKAMMAEYHTVDGTKIEVRIGLDCGPVVAGVIGENKFIYDMWSDAVNTASRMESSSIAGQVHVSERFKDAVTEYEKFDYVERGEIEIKGKGKMKTYFIEEKKR